MQGFSDDIEKLIREDEEKRRKAASDFINHSKNGFIDSYVQQEVFLVQFVGITILLSLSINLVKEILFAAVLNSFSL